MLIKNRRKVYISGGAGKEEVAKKRMSNTGEVSKFTGATKTSSPSHKRYNSCNGSDKIVTIIQQDRILGKDGR